VKDTVGSL